jgi:hypothetical protein
VGVVTGYRSIFILGERGMNGVYLGFVSIFFYSHSSFLFMFLWCGYLIGLAGNMPLVVADWLRLSLVFFACRVPRAVASADRYPKKERKKERMDGWVARLRLGHNLVGIHKLRLFFFSHGRRVCDLRLVPYLVVVRA